MTLLPGAPHSLRHRAATLAAIIVVQALCAVFFAADVIGDLALGGTEDTWHLWVESVAAVALVAGLLLQMFELRRLLHQMAQTEAGLRAARGEMAEVIGQFFDDWRLTPAERDVALLILKGIDNDTIARLRGTAAGTVRAQATAIYAKAGVDGRAQLFSLFMDELLSDSGLAASPA